MQTRRLGKTDLELTTVGLGTWAIGGGGWAFAWGPQDDRDSKAAIKYALDLGVNWIDTAPVYGLGHAEEMVGRVIRHMSGRPLIATKCSRIWDQQRRIGNSLRKESLLRELDDSLRRLRVDVIDLYQIHWPDPEEQLEEGWDTVARMVAAGKVRYAGVSNFSVDQMKRIQPIHPVASLQPPYSMLRRDVEKEILDFCRQHDIGVIPYSPMQKGLLTGKITRERIAGLAMDDHRRRDPMFNDPELSVNLEFVDKIGHLAATSNHSPAQLAVAWVLRRPEVTAAIVGARRPGQIEETVQAGAWRLDDATIGAVENLLAERTQRISEIGNNDAEKPSEPD